MDYEKKIRDYMNSSEVDQLYKSMLSNLFPELVEPKEEKARRSLLEFLEDLFKLGKNINFDRWSKADCEEWVNWVMKQGEQKPADKVEPKFKVGDEIRTKNEESLIISRIDRWGYWSEDLFICNFEDADKWELVEKKQEWSDEDKKLIDDTCHLINTLASGYGEKVTEPITFSGTQMIASIKDRLRALVDNRPQSQWKPSGEQIEAFEHFVRSIGESGYASLYDNTTKLLYSLLADLKKLREE